MLSTLFINQTVTAVADALTSAGARGRVAVVGQSRIGRALAARGFEVVLLAARPGSLRRARGARLYGSGEELPLGDDTLAALVGFGVGEHAGWQDVLGEWRRSVAEGGAIVMVDRGPPMELSRRALCGGLAEIQQRQAGRTTITSGLITKI
jgi:hypothetical protein